MGSGKPNRNMFAAQLQTCNRNSSPVSFIEENCIPKKQQELRSVSLPGVGNSQTCGTTELYISVLLLVMRLVQRVNTRVPGFPPCTLGHPSMLGGRKSILRKEFQAERTARVETLHCVPTAVLRIMRGPGA